MIFVVQIIYYCEIFLEILPGYKRFKTKKISLDLSSFFNIKILGIQFKSTLQTRWVEKTYITQFQILVEFIIYHYYNTMLNITRSSSIIIKMTRTFRCPTRSKSTDTFSRLDIQFTLNYHPIIILMNH